jgi:DNA-binding transcriptional MerR regulator
MSSRNISRKRNPTSSPPAWPPLSANQRLILDVIQLCRDLGLPSGDVRPIMQKVGDVNDYSADPETRQQYLDQVKALALAHPNRKSTKQGC